MWPVLPKWEWLPSLDHTSFPQLSGQCILLLSDTKGTGAIKEVYVPSTFTLPSPRRHTASFSFQVRKVYWILTVHCLIDCFCWKLFFSFGFIKIRMEPNQGNIFSLHRLTWRMDVDNRMACLCVLYRCISLFAAKTHSSRECDAMTWGRHGCNIVPSFICRKE